MIDNQLASATSLMDTKQLIQLPLFIFEMFNNSAVQPRFVQANILGAEMTGAVAFDAFYSFSFDKNTEISQRKK